MTRVKEGERKEAATGKEIDGNGNTIEKVKVEDFILSEESTESLDLILKLFSYSPHTIPTFLNFFYYPRSLSFHYTFLLNF